MGGDGDGLGVGELRDGRGDGVRVRAGAGLGRALGLGGGAGTTADDGLACGAGRTIRYSASTAANSPLSTMVDVRGRPVMPHPRWRRRCPGRRTP